MNDEGLKVREVSDSDLKLTLLSRSEVIRQVRKYVRKLASNVGFSEQQIFEIQLAINEAIANIIKHAYGGDADGKIEFAAQINNGSDLVIQIRDFGRKPERDKLRPRDLQKLAESGLGLFLIEQLMDHVEFDFSEETGTRLLLRKEQKAAH